VKFAVLLTITAILFGATALSCRGGGQSAEPGNGGAKAHNGESKAHNGEAKTHNGGAKANNGGAKANNGGAKPSSAKTAGSDSAPSPTAVLNEEGGGNGINGQSATESNNGGQGIAKQQPQNPTSELRTAPPTAAAQASVSPSAAASTPASPSNYGGAEPLPAATNHSASPNP